MNENVGLFFRLYHTDARLKSRVEEALALYPGSLEIREAVVESVLLPIAREMGLEFSLNDLRKYETRQKMSSVTKDDAQWLEEEIDNESSYWLIDKGWNSGMTQD